METFKEKINILNRINGFTFYGTLSFIALIIVLIELIFTLMSNHISLFNPFFLIELTMFIGMGLTTLYHWYVKEETLSFKVEPLKIAPIITQVEEVEEENEYEKDLTKEEKEDLRELEITLGHKKRVVVKEIVENPLTDEELEELARLEKEMGGK